ncbi:MAG: ATP-binding protein [Pseudomonadota bacterium]
MTGLNPRRLWRRYVLAVLLIAVTITVSHLSATIGTGNSALVAADVNISGRQRMLSQRITLFARSYVEATDPQEKVEFRNVLQSDLDLFLESHTILRERDYMSALHRQSYDGTGDMPGLNDLTDQFTSYIGTILTADRTSQLEALSDLQDLSTGLLLSRLNASVWQFELSVQRIESEELRIANIAFATALLLLIGEAIFIFWPAQRAINRTLDGLEDAQRQAEQNHLDFIDAAREREAALSAKATFFSMISHELRTPLNAVVAGADILRDAKLSATDDEMLDLVTNGADELAEKIDVLLSLSSDADQPAVKTERFNPLDVIARMTEAARSKMEKPGVRVTLETSIPHETEVIGARNVLSEAFGVVLDNAIKFTEKGVISVSLSMTDGDTETNVVVVVEDSGPGISPAIAAVLFDAFTQGDARTSRIKDGFGLGLFKAKQALSLAKGEIVYAPAANGGSRFTILLPALQKHGVKKAEFST